MATNIFIGALGQAIFESCGQALLIYISLQLFMQLFPGIGSKHRYRINYAALTVICGWFLVTLVNGYLSRLQMLSLYAVGNINFAAVSDIHTPTLLQQAEAFISKYAAYITGLYMIGLVLHTFRLLGGLVNIHHIRKQKNLIADSFWNSRAIEFAHSLNIRKRVAMYFSEHVQVPLTIGHLKPIVIFPLALINNLDHEQVEAILLHELAHIKRHDYLFNMLQCIMETILCFNPFVWLLSKAIREEREYCCDDVVVEATSNNFIYAKALFMIAQQSNESYALAMASTGTKKYPLLNRIKRLNAMKKNDTLPKFHLFIIVSVLAVGVLLAWGIPQYSIAKAASHKAVINMHEEVHVTTVEHKTVSTTVKHKASVKCKSVAAITADRDSTLNTGKGKYKIIADAKDSDKLDVSNPLKNMPNADSISASVNKMMASPEWKKQMAYIQKQSEQINKQFNSPEWKKQQKAIEKEALAMSRQFNSEKWHKQEEAYNKQADAWKAKAEVMEKNYSNSPEWKKQQADMMTQAEEIKKQYNTPEFKKQVAYMKKYFKSPEWKKQVAEMKRQYNSPEFKKQAAEMKKYFNSPEWKKQEAEIKRQAAEIKKQFNSPEWKKQMADMQKNANDQARENMQKAQADSVKNE